MENRYDKIMLESLRKHYLTNIDLRFNKEYGYQLSNEELEEYLAYKEDYENNLKMDLPLKTFNSKKVFYFYCKELNNCFNDYASFISKDLELNSTIIRDNYEAMAFSNIFSEIEGTLKIEGVNTTRKRIAEVYKSNNPKNQNDQIIYNMINGYRFINTKPRFNKDNLRLLYKLLSYECLEKNDELNDNYYRKEMVVVGGHEGAKVEDIDACMDSLFHFVNKTIQSKNTQEKLLTFYLPTIAQYYILYVHPYIDYNGRTARMVSIWLCMLLGNVALSPMYISEAINDDKNKYYEALDNTRNSHNDLTYFLIYIMTLSNRYYLVYKNIKAIKDEMALTGETLTSTEIYYLKRIIINSKRGWFNYKGFMEFANIEITKQGAFKILNYFLELELIVAKINKKNEKVFKLNEDKIKYALNY